jgi:hypothetical protein
LYRLSIERAKADAEREPGYQQRDYAAIEGAMRQMERRYHPKMDRELQRYWLMQYIKLPQQQRLMQMDKWLDGNDEKAVNKQLKNLSETKLGDTAERLKWMQADRKAFEASKDPAIRFAVAVTPALLQLEEARKTRAGDAMVARPVYLQAVAEFKKSKKEFVHLRQCDGLYQARRDAAAAVHIAGRSRRQGDGRRALRRAAGATRCDQSQTLRWICRR